MRRLLCLLLFITSITILSAQSNKLLNNKILRKFRTSFETEKKNRVLISLTHDNLFHKETNGFKTKWFSRGVSFAMMGDLDIKNSQFSLALGVGYSFSTFYHNAKLEEQSTGVVIAKVLNSKEAEIIKRSKLGIHYIDIPFELRYQSIPNKKNKSFQFAVGAKWSIKAGASTKEVRKDADGKFQHFKVSNYRDVQAFRFGPTFRIGYGSLGLNAFYNAIPLFKKDRGPKMNAFSIGLTLALF